MKRVLLSGGILAGDVLAHAWSGFPTSPAATGVGISLATAMGLALAIRHFAVVFAQAVSAGDGFESPLLETDWRNPR